MKLIMIDHPCYGIDIVETDDPAEIEAVERQGYIRERVLRAAPKMLRVLEGKIPSFAQDLEFIAVSLETLGQGESAEYLRRRATEIKQLLAEVRE